MGDDEETSVMLEGGSFASSWPLEEEEKDLKRKEWRGMSKRVVGWRWKEEGRWVRWWRRRRRALIAEEPCWGLGRERERVGESRRESEREIDEKNEIPRRNNLRKTSVFS